MEEGLKIVGKVRAEIVRGDGSVEVYEFYNILTTYGKDSITDNLLQSVTRGKPTHIQVGTGTTPAAIGDTALGTPFGARQALSPAISRTANALTAQTTFAAGYFSGQNITEYGLFSHLTNAECWCRQVQTAKNLTSADALTVTWTLTVG
jgi:hypothetical protein